MIDLAYPQNAASLKRARARAEGAPNTSTVYPYSWGVLRQLPADSVAIEWDDVEDDGPLVDALILQVTPGEAQGLEDISIPLDEWLARCKPDPARSDLSFLLDLLPAHAWDSLDLPVRYRGPPLGRVTSKPPRIHYQRKPLQKERFPLAPIIRRPIRVPRVPGRPIVDLALQALCPRELEIYPLIYANPKDVRLASCGRGIQVAIVGVAPERRSPLESLYFFLVVKNGIPIAYGPASVFSGCCEMGINLFPEFRGGEIRYVYAQVMRVLRHLLGVEYYFLTSYGMGEGNPDAVRSGAFWFYRKLGFSATNPKVEALAREEERKMQAQKTYRSDRRMLRRLSHTEAHFDLSQGRCRPFDFGALGIALSRFLVERYGGDRKLAERRCAARMRRLAGASWPPLDPLLCMIPDLPRWSARDRAALGRILRAKAGSSEVAAARLFKSHARLRRALRAIG